MSKMSASILKQFSILVEFLGHALGPDYEVVLHDVSKENQSIVAIANPHISGRRVGGPLTNTALQQLSNREYEFCDFTENYVGTVRNGRLVRSATMYIKDKDGEPVGLLCLNYDDSRFQEMQRQYQQIIHPKDWLQALAEVQAKLCCPVDKSGDTQPMVLETFYDNIADLMEEIYRDVSADISIPADHLSQQDRLNLVEKLEKRGIFKLKGSVPFVAEKLACSQATIYRYLNQLAQASQAGGDA